MKQQELKKVLELHRKWVMGESDGVRADLSSADLRFANLRSANLRSADLRSADLSSADLSSADLRFANLRSADLSSADLSSADLSSADLRFANLRSADLKFIKEDFFKRLDLVKKEAIGLYKFVHEGKIEGKAYQGECACFVGSIANLKKVHYGTLIELKPDADSLTEKFFMGIAKGDTPKNNPVSEVVSEWLVEFLKSNNMKVPTMKVIWK